MCGRTALALDPSEIQVRIGASQWIDGSAYRPSHNVAPTRYQPVIRRDRNTNNGEPFLHSMRWGVIPSWTKESPTYKSALQTINARDERIREGKSMWAGLKHTKRCVVIAEGFFEWLKKGKERHPYYIRHEDERLIMFAGLWDRAVVDEKEIFSYTIVTTESSKALSWLHDRMPVVLNTMQDVETWLDPDKKFTEEVSTLMRPTESGLKWHPVSTFVSKVGNDSSQCVEPVTLPTDTGKGTLFAYFSKPGAKLPPTSPNPTKPSSPTTPHRQGSKPTNPTQSTSSPQKTKPEVFSKQDKADKEMRDERHNDHFEQDLKLALQKSRDDQMFLTAVPITTTSPPKRKRDETSAAADTGRHVKTAKVAHGAEDVNKEVEEKLKREQAPSIVNSA
ncbi:hypothetical protein DFJ77DRAFT_68381 [Powellomyces hirtus]|nr:hypothetical protein DFJ77DRAFT_68381 [Powellomyces hirtus]